MELVAGVLEWVVVGQVTDVTEQAVLGLAAIIAKRTMIGLAANVKNSYNKFKSQRHED